MHSAIGTHETKNQKKTGKKKRIIIVNSLVHSMYTLSNNIGCYYLYRLEFNVRCIANFFHRCIASGINSSLIARLTCMCVYVLSVSISARELDEIEFLLNKLMLYDKFLYVSLFKFLYELFHSFFLILLSANISSSHTKIYPLKMVNEMLCSMQ